ncbi:hypothetical protein BAE44_0005182, partial [Dichanthelium oligosanthes]
LLSLAVSPVSLAAALAHQRYWRRFFPWKAAAGGGARRLGSAAAAVPGRGFGGGVRRAPVPDTGRQVPVERDEAGVCADMLDGLIDAVVGLAQGALLLPHLRPGRPGGRRLRLPRHQRQRPRRQPRRRRRPHPPRQLLRPQCACRLHLRLAASRPAGLMQ